MQAEQLRSQAPVSLRAYCSEGSTRSNEQERPSRDGNGVEGGNGNGKSNGDGNWDGDGKGPGPGTGTRAKAETRTERGAERKREHQRRRERGRELERKLTKGIEGKKLGNPPHHNIYRVRDVRSGATPAGDQQHHSRDLMPEQARRVI